MELLITILLLAAFVATILNSKPYISLMNYVARVFDRFNLQHVNLDHFFCCLCIGFWVGLGYGFATHSVLIAGAVAICAELLDRVLKKILI